MPKKECKECYADFHTHLTAPHQEFCSTECRNKWHNNRRRYNLSDRIIKIPKTMTDENYELVKKFVGIVST